MVRLSILKIISPGEIFGRRSSNQSFPKKNNSIATALEEDTLIQKNHVERFSGFH